MKIEDIQKQQYLGNIQYIDDKVIYTKATYKDDLSGYNYNLFMYDPKQKKNIQLTSSNSDTSFEQFDDTTILFTTKRKQEKGTSFYTISLRGGEATPLFTIPCPVSKLKRIEKDLYIFIGINDITYDDYLLSEEKAKIDALKEEEKDYEVIDELPYVQNGRGFTNKLRKALYLYDASSDTYTKLSTQYIDIGDYLIVDHLIYFYGNEYEIMSKNEHILFVYDLDTKQTACLLDHRLSIHSILYFNEELVIIGHDNHKYEFNKNAEIFTLKNGDLHFELDHDVSYGSKIATDVKLIGGNSLRVYDDLVYTTIAQISHSEMYTFSLKEPLTKITDFNGCIDCFAKNGDKIYFIGMKDEHLQELYCYDGENYEQLTHWNQETEALGFSKPLAIRYTKNEIMYEGFVIYPYHYDPTQTYPAILEIHGGPKATNGDIYFYEMQLMASKGYFVFYTNPRGSDGRGNEFADVYGKMGVIDYQDIMDFTKIVLDQLPQIDRKRIGVTGGSYGGYMTNWIIGHTNMFSAAVSQRSISNYVSKSLTTDIGFIHNMKQTMATPWDNVEKMWYHSPLQYANHATTPTLFIQSDEDYRCWQGDAYQMYQALVLNGCKAKMVLFHGENHELSRSGKPKHRIRRLTEMMNWFDQYIGG